MVIILGVPIFRIFTVNIMHHQTMCCENVAQLLSSELIE